MSKFRCCPKHPYINNIKVVLLNNKEICYKFTNDTLVEDIFHDVCSSMDLHERDIFGLAMLCNDEGWLFLEPSEFMHRIITNYFATTDQKCSAGILSLPINKSTYHCSLQSSYPTVYFRIRFYLPIHCINERATQHIYYLQLRRNHVAYELFCDPNVYFQLAAFALQAELGDAPKCFNPESETSYFLPELYYPKKFVKSCDSVELAYYTYIHHSALHNTVTYLAEFHFIHLATKLNSDFNLHLYPLEKPTHKCRFSVWIGISPQGVTLYQQFPDYWIVPTNRIKWNEIKRIYYNHHTVTIHLRPKARRRDFKMKRTLSARHLFALITNMHFYQSIAEMSATHSNDLLGKIELRYSIKPSI
ncbi:unnamed protein product [Schistosoma bovis]|nr:unnamed protein product [Schistosoma bovis]